ncbi:hypothetical protein [Desulfovibrio sp. TomC]|uniref:hypothetical protein n=1 Tax=Desulfovibrio sp. TomC TaxID=1562888 RepID=UPI0005741C09|nr:hypothetical protein [Desulfovibrio sp. TomC]KHK00858.1 hypothetical protein NY78_3746 [Desulfovibrio sp. TomC]
MTAVPDMPNMTDIRDIKGPLPLAGPHDWLALAAGLGCLVLAGLALWRFWRARQGRSGPRRRFAAALAALGPQGQGLDDREYYFRLTRLVRAMLEADDGFPATTMTATEITARLGQAALDPARTANLAALLARAEAICFAADPAEAAIRPDRERDWQTARTLLPGRRP